MNVIGFELPQVNSRPFERRRLFTIVEVYQHCLPLAEATYYVRQIGSGMSAASSRQFCGR